MGRQVERQRRKQQPLRERREPDGEISEADERHQARILPAPADRRVPPLAERRIGEAGREGNQPDGDPIPLLDRGRAYGEKSNKERCSTDQHVPNRAVRDGEGNLVLRCLRPDRVQRQLCKFPNQVDASQAPKIPADKLPRPAIAIPEHRGGYWQDSAIAALISFGEANTIEARSPCMPASTTTGLPEAGPSLLVSVLKRRLNSQTFSDLPSAVSTV